MLLWVQLRVFWSRQLELIVCMRMRHIENCNRHFELCRPENILTMIATSDNTDATKEPRFNGKFLMAHTAERRMLG